MSGTATSALTPAQASAVLEAIKANLSIVLTSGSRLVPGQLASATLLPATPEIDASELANGVLNLAFVAKNVLFKDPKPVAVPDAGDLTGDDLAPTVANPGDPPTEVLGGLPFPAPVGLTTTPSTATATNVPGDLGQVFGSIALPRLRVSVSVTWRLTRQKNPKSRWGERTPQVEGKDFIAMNGLSSPTVSLAIPPPFEELRLDTIASPQPDRACLFADVTLALGGSDDGTSEHVPVKLGPFTLGPLEILLLPVLMPTVVAMFSEPNFGATNTGTVLVMVPEHSPLSSARALFDHLRRVESALDAVRGIGGVAAWLLGIDELLDAIPDQPRVRFKATNQIPRLGDVVIKPGVVFSLGETTFDDQTHSIAVLGLPGTQVNFFNDTDFKHTDQGMYVVGIGAAPFVAIRDLEDGDSKSEPPRTMPPGVIATFEPDTTDDDHDWEDSLSSVQFDPDWLSFVAEQAKTGPVDPPAGGCLVVLPPFGDLE
ncbi:MAG: hypothetical protein JO257_16365 [Deltaproteobacteria bacterium]|nr:hypothetical protein [Deltaproteobacteria bacterium]